MPPAAHICFRLACLFSSALVRIVRSCLHYHLENVSPNSSPVQLQCLDSSRIQSRTCPPSHQKPRSRTSNSVLEPSLSHSLYVNLSSMLSPHLNHRLDIIGIALPLPVKSSSL